jgi:electron transport complex protein RnfG
MSHVRRERFLCCVAVVAMAVSATDAAPQISRDEALAFAYPGATFSADRLFLTAEQMKNAATRAGEPVRTPLIARYTARVGGAVVGRAYIETHTVRTKKESLLISLDRAGKVQRVDVVAFLEPAEYLAPTPFLDQFTGRHLEDDVRLHRAIRPIAGATLTAGAVTEAVRRVLAIDEVLGAADADRQSEGGR